MKAIMSLTAIVLLAGCQTAQSPDQAEVAKNLTKAEQGDVLAQFQLSVGLTRS